MNHEKMPEQKPPVAEPELSDEDAADIFFSFDITTLAFVWESRQDFEEEYAELTRLPKPKKASEFAGLVAAVGLLLREFFKKPRNYAYMALVALLAITIWHIKPLTEEAKEKLIAMLPPELELPKPPEPEPPPPPPEPEPPPPEPEPEPEPEPIPEEELEPLKVEEQRQLDELRKKLELDRRNEEMYQGLKVPATRRDDVAPDLPSAFGRVSKRPGDELPTSLSQIGTKRRGKVIGRSGKPLKIGGRKKKRAEPEETKLAAPIVKKKPKFERTDEDIRGRWVKIENLGPLAHLNSKCYGKKDGEIVYVGRYKLKCRDNQIVEAWRRE